MAGLGERVVAGGRLVRRLDGGGARLSSAGTGVKAQRILPPDAIRALPKGKALLLATGIRVAMLNLKPWYKEPSAQAIGPASARATAAITERARAKNTSEGLEKRA
jgi:hypothetical protein